MSEEQNIPGLWPASAPLKSRQDSQRPSLLSARKTRAERRRELALRLAETQEQAALLKEELKEDPTPEPPKDPSSSPAKIWRNLRSLPTKWQFWLIIGALVPGIMGVSAIAFLLNLSTRPNCLGIFLPAASAADRLYCAEVMANRQTVDDLLKAIDLVNALPTDHPLRSEINRNIQQWSEDILKLAEATFQQGKLAEAVSTVRRIPKEVPAYPLVEKQIQQWQSIWSEAEGIYRAAEDYLRKEDWGQAFRQATLLLSLGNTYWETTKYEELTTLIQTAKTDGGKLAKARSTAEKGGLENLLTAIKLAEEIGQNSHVYTAAQKVIGELSQQIFEIAETKLKAGDWQVAIDTVNKIPAGANLKEEVKDFTELARAASQGLTGTVAGLESAIKAAQKIGSDRPLHSKVQDYILFWQQEIADVKTLERAQQLAVPGGMGDLRAAITQLQTIAFSNPRGQQAQKEVERLTRQLELLEDQPILDKAEQLANVGSVDGLLAAIAQARQISQGRALYQEAQNKIQRWSARSQEMEDQPFLEQADQLAAGGNLAAAISAAEHIVPGRALYEEARSRIRNWQSQFEGEQSLQNARQAAQGGTADALETAILLASQVPESSVSRWEANEVINEWSQRIYAIGLAQATSDVAGAIATLRKIPPGTQVAQEAQGQIRAWQDSLNPVPVESEASEAKEDKPPKFPDGVTQF